MREKVGATCSYTHDKVVLWWEGGRGVCGDGYGYGDVGSGDGGDGDGEGDACGVRW